MILKLRILIAHLLVLAVAFGGGRTLAQSSESATTSEVKRVRILTVGNSFTNDATYFLDELAEAAGHELIQKSLIIGGSPIERHASMATAFESDRDAPETRYSGGESLQEALQAEPWDYVTFQQLSRISHDVSTYQPHANRIAAITHRYAPQAQILIHQTWPYRKDDPRFTGSAKPGEPVTQEAMYRGLKEAYVTIASELHAKRIPVGDAFWIAENDGEYGHRVDESFDPKTATDGALPDQSHSLHVGYRWRTDDGKRSLRMDGHHASPAGRYLGACVWFECLFGDSAIGNSFHPQSLSDDYAAFLQRVAHEAVAAAKDSVQGPPHVQAAAFDDPDPKRYEFRQRASELDGETREYPEIRFGFGSDDKPQDLQVASVDTRVAPQGKLVVWLMGHNDRLAERINGYGMHAITVSYARGWFGILCRPQPADAYARGRVRLEAATGLDFSDELHLAEPDGAAHRVLQFVRWLDLHHPQGDWGQFLADDATRLRWDKITVAGASHGSTTAARFAKHQRVDRVVMLCGPRDQDQDWQGLPSATPANRFFGFSHVLDGGWTGDHYCRSWELLGLHRFGAIINVDASSPPYDNTRRLISNADVGGDAKRAHSSVSPGGSSPKTAEGELMYEPVWRYLFNHPVDVVGQSTEEDPNCLRNHVEYE